jgi:hypothetical protein
MPPEGLLPINAYVKNVFGYLGCVDGGFIWQNECIKPKDIKKFPEKLKEAEALGKSLVK